MNAHFGSVGVWRLAILFCGVLALAVSVRAGAVLTWADTNIWLGASDVVAIAAGSYHQLALHQDGTVEASGSNWLGQSDVPPGLSNAVAIAAGWNHSVALRGDGIVVVWGDNMFGQTNVPPGLTNARTIASGQNHCLALTVGGQLVAWGQNSYGQAQVPSNLTNVVAIAAGGAHSLALRNDGTVVAWGKNVSGQAAVPAGVTNAVAIAAGGDHSLVLRSDGTVLAWGSNQSGATNVPLGLTNVVAIAGGFLQSLALTDTGTIVLWGDYGAAPPPHGLSNAIAISLGVSVGMALVNDGAPVATVHPFSQTIVTGHKAVFRVLAAGVKPIHYQWQRDGVDLPDATNASLELPAVQLSDAGSYAVVLSNTVGQSRSRPANLSALEVPPSVQVQPAHQQLFSGGEASFHVAAQGSLPLTYQWRRDGLDLPGATNADLTLPEAQPADGGVYTVVVGNSAGQIESEPVALNVIVSPPLIRLQPTEQRVAYGGGATFHATVEGSLPISYQWFLGSAAIPGAVGATLVVTNADSSKAGLYWVRISNAYGTVASAPVLLRLVFNYEFTALEGPLIWDFSGTYPSPLLTLQQDPDGFLANSAGAYGRVWKNGSVVGLNLTTPRPTDYWIEYSPTHIEYVLQNSCTATLTLNAANPSQRSLAGDNSCVRVGQEYEWFLFTWAPYRNLTTTRHSSPVSQLLPDAVNGHWRLELGAGPDGKQPGGQASITLSSSNVIWLDLTSENSTLNKRVMHLQSGLNHLTLVTTGPEMFLESIHGNVAFQSIDYDAPVRRTALLLNTNGGGHVALPGKGQSLVIGRDYTLEAVPRPGNLFSNWIVAGTVVNGPTLRFTMSSNLSVSANFVPNPFVALKGNYTGLFYNTNAPTHENAGVVNMTLGDKGAFSGAIRHGASRYPFSGQFSLSLAAEKAVSRRGTNEIVVHLQLAAGSDEIHGVVSNETWISEAFGYRAGFSRREPATNFQGAYNALLPGTDDPENGPYGHGFAQIVVNRSGDLRFTGTLADGSSIARAGPLAANGQWPLYTEIYSGRGSLLGWLTLLDTYTNDVVGRVLWTRPDGVKGSLHPSGFTNEIEAIGSRYVSPEPGARVLDFTEATIDLDGGNLPEPLTNTVFLNDRNRILIDGPNAQQVSVGLAVSSGLFNGSFIHPANGRQSAIKGVLLPKQNLGAGLFPGTNQSGRVVFKAVE